MPNVTKTETLRDLSFGNQVAEEEREFLSSYFVRTQAWDRIFNGDIDIVYGQKGAGKSAIYVLISDSADDLFDRGILLIAAENPRGSPAFGDLKNAPPTSEREFVAVWKLYFASLIARALEDYKISNSHSQRARAILAEHGLAAPVESNLASILRSVRTFVLRMLSPKTIEGTIHTSTSGDVQGYTGKITFDEPDLGDKARGVVSVDNLLEMASSALGDAGSSGL